MTEHRQRVTPWWQPDQGGAYVLTIRFGRRVIEFEKDKPGIAVPALDKLPSIIDTVIAAARAGELDQYMKPVKKPQVTAKAMSTPAAKRAS